MKPPRRLLASIHDVTPVHADRLERLIPLVEEIVGRGRYALLVVPDFHRRGPLQDDRAFSARLRAWADSGCEIFLHGFTHLDESRHDSIGARWAASRLTAGEGEFLGLPRPEADRRLLEGKAIVEQAIGRAVDGFVAPAWLYGDASLAALSAQGFGLVEDHFRVWDPRDGRLFARGPVVTYASRSITRLMGSILWSRLATIGLARARTVRFAVHPHDVDSPALVREIERALRAFARSHLPSAYADLVAD